MMQRSRLACRWHARGRFCVALTTALAITVVMHIAVLIMFVDSQYALRNNQPNAHLAPHRLMHSGSTGRNKAAYSKGASTHSAVAHYHGNRKQFDRSRKFANIHEPVNYRFAVNHGRYVRKIGYIKRRRRVHKGGAPKQYPEGRNGQRVNTLGGDASILQADITIDELMPVRHVLPPARRDRVV